ncbi:MAG: hypothetical protein DME65_09510 [Verrucomicrobia bacterium]|nr:MAG: hypothetical protein DME65_09510 [Verrucomicrobiota bacterium]
MKILFSIAAKNFLDWKNKRACPREKKKSNATADPGKISCATRDRPPRLTRSIDSLWHDATPDLTEWSRARNFLASTVSRDLWYIENAGDAHEDTEPSELQLELEQ